ncbi:AB hydrolase-1 domain-containing protein [Mycena kentingensis (nom. inval.)]|nr:AB hydrolase-1 domain-containing protein [Mycena kentingensis (nom. inval.)]
MLTLKLANGTHFRYADSGAPPGSEDYATLVGFHGDAFNADSFEPLHSSAHKHNLRTIFIAQCHYCGSTPYTDAEIAGLLSGDQDAYDAMALETARILEWLVDNAGARNILAMGWDTGCTPVLALLGNPDAIPHALHWKLEPHLWGIVLYGNYALIIVFDAPTEPRYTTLGLTTAPEYEIPENTDAEFARCVSGHITSIPMSRQDFCRSMGQQRVTPWIFGPMSRRSGGASQSRGRAPLSDAESLRTTFEAQTHRAIFDPSAVSRHFPSADVLYIAGDESAPSCVSAYTEFQRLVEEESAVRKVEFVLMPGQNHFIHYSYETPDALLDEIKRHLDFVDLGDDASPVVCTVIICKCLANITSSYALMHRSHLIKFCARIVVETGKRSWRVEIMRLNISPLTESKMPTWTEATLKLASGSEFHYTDSGAPTDGLSHQTIVALHGTGFNNGTFEGVHQYAHKMNALNTGEETAYEGLGLELVQMLEQLVDHGARRLVVVGWSSSAVLLTALLANTDAISRDLYAKLELHIEGFVIYDPPYQMISVPQVPEITISFLSPEIVAAGPEVLTEAFERWISGHYVHPDIAFGVPSGVFTGDAAQCTMDKWSKEEHTRWSESGPGLRSLIPPEHAEKVTALLTAQTNRALFDAETAKTCFPRVKVLYMSGEETVPICIWAYMGVLRRVQEGQAARDVRFALVPKQNHLMHYEAPEVFLKEIVASLE